MTDGLVNQILKLRLPEKLSTEEAVFTTLLIDPDGDASAITVTVEHLADGFYEASFTPDAEGNWTLWIDSDDLTEELTWTLDIAAALTGDSSTFSLDTVKSYLGWRADEYTDSEIQQAADFALTLAESYCGRKFSVSEYTEKYDGTGTPYLVLKQTPVQSVESVDVSSTRVTDCYEIEGNILIHIDGAWTKGFRNITVTYTAGYSTVPGDVQLAVCMMAADILDSPGYNRQLKTEQVGEHTFGMKDTDFITPYAGLLGKHRKVRV